jgi:hypothetical protein
VRLYNRAFRRRERFNLADCLLTVSAVDALALAICDTLIYQTGALDGYVRSERLSKVSSGSRICGPDMHVSLVARIKAEMWLLTSADPVCFKLLLQFRDGLPKGQYARLLLELLRSRTSTADT